MTLSFRSSFLRLTVATLIATIVPSCFFNKNNGDGTTTRSSGAIVIFANGQLSSQSIVDKWALDFNASATRLEDGDPKRFSLIYYVDPSIVTGNTAGQLFTEDCISAIGDNTTGLEISGGISNIETNVVDVGVANFQFDIDMATLVLNENVTQNQPDQSGTMKMCSRFSLQTADGSYEVNFLENIITINFAFDGDFSIEFLVAPKDDLVEEANQGYEPDAYLCDPGNPGQPLPTDKPFVPGEVLSVCVTPKKEAKDDGLFMKSIDSFKWYRGGTEQIVVDEGEVAGDNLSILVCEPDNLFCSMSSVLYAAFYQPTQSPSEIPSSVPSPEPTAAPSAAPTSIPEWTFTFPATTTSEFVHALSVNHAGNDWWVGTHNLDITVTSTDTGLSYQQDLNTPMLDAVTAWGNSGYAIHGLKNRIDTGYYGIYLRPSKMSSIPSGTVITVNIKGFPLAETNNVILCAHVETSSPPPPSTGKRHGGWNLLGGIPHNFFAQQYATWYYDVNLYNSARQSLMQTFCKAANAERRRDLMDEKEEERMVPPRSATSSKIDDEDAAKDDGSGATQSFVNDDHRDLQGNQNTIQGAGTATLKFPSRRRFLSGNTKDGRQQRALQEFIPSSDIPTVTVNVVQIDDDPSLLQTAGGASNKVGGSFWTTTAFLLSSQLLMFIFGA